MKVLLIAAGNIKSNIGNAQYRLPDDSLYKPIEAEWISARLQGFQGALILSCGRSFAQLFSVAMIPATASPRAPMIAEIVTESLKSAPRAWLWIAFNSTVVWFVSTFLSRTAFVSIIPLHLRVLGSKDSHAGSHSVEEIRSYKACSNSVGGEDVECVKVWWTSLRRHTIPTS